MEKTRHTLKQSAALAAKRARYNSYRASLQVQPNGYGFGYDWQLILCHAGQIRTYWLGQDVKVCQRWLNLTIPELLTNVFGSPTYKVDLRKRRDKEALGKYIFEQLKATYRGDPENAAKAAWDLDPWALAAE